MAASNLTKTIGEVRVFTKETLERGQPIHVKCVEVNGQTYVLSTGIVTVASLEDEWFEDVYAPESVIQTLKRSTGFKPDIFTFWQRLPDLNPRYDYWMEWESIAALPISTYEDWFSKRIRGATRNMIRKSQKAGVETRETNFDDDFVKGMHDIFNESPVRQGRRFWHYGKDCRTIKRQFSRFLFREDLIGAYCQNELVGFVMLANAGRFGVLGEFISKMEHRDKATNNALMAKTVEVCARRQFSHLTYGSWIGSSLDNFKRHSGFEEVKLPRYFVPLTPKGRAALKLGLHRSWRELLPRKLTHSLKRLRSRWYELTGAE